MQELGYVEGRNLAVELRFVEGDVARLDALASELVKVRVDVIVAAGATAVRAAQKASSKIPIVMGRPATRSAPASSRAWRVPAGTSPD